MQKETRLAEVRLEETDDKMILEGYAIVFDEETLIGDEERGFIEVISRDALNEQAIKDVPMKYNHMDSFLIIARTKNGSLSLTVDDKGLKVTEELIDTESNEDIYKMVRSGLLDKMSFAFTVKNQTWDRSGAIPKRTIKEIDRLYDVSIVDVPAYEGTSIYARSLELLDSETRELENLKLEHKKMIIRKKIKNPF